VWRSVCGGTVGGRLGRLRRACATYFCRLERSPAREQRWCCAVWHTGRSPCAGRSRWCAGRGARRSWTVCAKKGTARLWRPVPSRRTCAGGSHRRSPADRASTSWTRAPVSERTRSHTASLRPSRVLRSGGATSAAQSAVDRDPTVGRAWRRGGMARRCWHCRSRSGSADWTQRQNAWRAARRGGRVGGADRLARAQDAKNAATQETALGARRRRAGALPWTARQQRRTSGNPAREAVSGLGRSCLCAARSCVKQVGPCTAQSVGFMAPSAPAGPLQSRQRRAPCSPAPVPPCEADTAAFPQDAAGPGRGPAGAVWRRAPPRCATTAVT
jgi:hypothetical protein